jgi:rhodanese-related sulfurtransferase
MHEERMAANVTTQGLHGMLNGGSPPGVLDVRSAAEFATGHVPGAINIPMEELEARLADLPAGSLVVVCESGKRAEVAAGWLGDESRLTLLEGGTKAWRDGNYPLVTCTPCRWTPERQVRLIAGLLVLAATILSVLVSARWVYLAMLVGAGLTFAGASNICGMAILLAKMPWNAQRSSAVKPDAFGGLNCRS